MAQQPSSGALLDSMLERPDFFDHRKSKMLPTSTVQTQTVYSQAPNSQYDSYASGANNAPGTNRPFIETRGPQVPNSHGVRETNFEQQSSSYLQNDSDAQYIVSDHPNQPTRHQAYANQDELDAQYLVLPKSSEPRGQVMSGHLVENGSEFKRTANGEYADPFQSNNAFNSRQSVPNVMHNAKSMQNTAHIQNAPPSNRVEQNKPLPQKSLQNQDTTLEQRARLLDKFNARVEGWQMPSTLPGNHTLEQFSGLDTYDFNTDIADEIVDDSTEFNEPIEPVLDFAPTQTVTRKDTNLGDWKLNAEKKSAAGSEPDTEIASAIQPPPVLPIKKPAETETSEVSVPSTDPPLPMPVVSNTGPESVLDASAITPTLRMPAPAAKVAMLSPSHTKTAAPKLDVPSIAPAAFASNASPNQAQAQQSNANVKIHPPMVQPYRKNQYTFVIENTGAKNANEVIVGITVPQWAKVSAVIPQAAQIDERTALVRFEKIEPGQQQQVHITADSLTGQPISFDATLTSKTVQNFAPGGQTASQAVSPAQVAPNAFNQAPAYQAPTNQTQTVQPKAPNAQAFDLNKLLKQHVAANSGRFGADLAINGLPVADAPQQMGDTGRVQNPYFGQIQQAPSVPPPNLHLPSQQYIDPNPKRATQQTGANAVNTAGNQAARGPKQNYVASAIITGPRQLEKGKTADYEITIANQTGVAANDVLMHLAIPAGLKVLAAEPNAHYDDTTRMVSWSIPTVQHAETKMLRYRVQATGERLQKQKGTLQIGQQTIGDTYFATKILDGSVDVADVAEGSKPTANQSQR